MTSERRDASPEDASEMHQAEQLTLEQRVERLERIVQEIANHLDPPTTRRSLDEQLAGFMNELDAKGIRRRFIASRK